MNITYLRRSLIILLLICFFIGCSEDEDQYPTQIVGKWTFVKTETANTSSSGTIHTTLDHPADRYFEFMEGGTVLIKNHDTVVNTNSWRVEGSKLFITGSNSLGHPTSELEIRKLTSNELRISYKDEDGSFTSEWTHYLSR
jgi:hypothetical protein